MVHLAVATLWENFRQAVVPKNASEAQVKDMQGAFYAGVGSIMSVMRQIGEDEDISEDQGGELMMALEREVKRYTVELAAQAMASAISRATGTQVHVKVHDITKPPGGAH
jgi:hypothetical protein